MGNLTGIIRLLKKEQDRLTRELRGISAALAAFGAAYRDGHQTRAQKALPKRRKRTLSAAGRKRIAAAQRARWAKVKAEKKTASVH